MKMTLTGKHNVTLYIYDTCKYTTKSEELIENEKVVKYNDIEAFEVVSDDAANKIEQESDGSRIDDLHEYLVLYHENGETSTYRNSYVDMFHI